MTEQKMPPWSTQAKNAAGAIGRAVQALATGAPVVAPRATGSIRERICLTCPSSSPTDVPVLNRRCAACGCFLAAKLQLATESCPKGKW